LSSAARLGNSSYGRATPSGAKEFCFMTIKRIFSAALILLSGSGLFAGCAAATNGPPPGSIPSTKSCTTNLNCNNVPLPSCMLNQHFCWEGKCQIKRDPSCTTPEPIATAVTPSPVPTLSPTIEPAPVPPPN
jgi:hypothetical protein